MVKKMLHRIVIVWCIYGFVRVCIWANPLLFRVAKIIMPLWWDSLVDPKFDEPWNCTAPEQILVVWFCVLVIMIVVVLVFAALHAFSNWFFNEKKED